MKIAYANTFINSLRGGGMKREEKKEREREREEGLEQTTLKSCFSMFRKITSSLCMFQSRRRLDARRTIAISIINFADNRRG